MNTLATLGRAQQQRPLRSGDGDSIMLYMTRPRRDESPIAFRFRGESSFNRTKNHQCKSLAGLASNTDVGPVPSARLDGFACGFRPRVSTYLAHASALESRSRDGCRSPSLQSIGPCRSPPQLRRRDPCRARTRFRKHACEAFG